MEELMIKAIRQFKREHRDCQIRNVHCWEYSTKRGVIDYALFNIEYVDKDGDYEEVNISTTNWI